MADERNIVKENIEDMGVFLGWLILGVLVGWALAFLAGHAWLESPIYDFYGVAGAVVAVMYASFRRQKHLEHLQHLPHVRRNLEVQAVKRKK